MVAQMLVCLGLLGSCLAEEPAAPASTRSADLQDYQKARKEAGRDARAHVRLALWCEAHGLGTERMKHLAMAVLYDPSNGLARGLMGLVAYQGKWARPDDVSRQAQEDPRRKALMQEYFQRRAKISESADDQWKLALWCEQNGLKDQAIAQYHAVLRRDPSRESAWKRLGFKKVGGRWIKPEWQAAQKHEAEQQNRANKQWRPRLERLREGLSSRDKARRAAAEGSMSGVTDPRAVPMIWAVFVPKGAEGQVTAVRLLGQIDAPGASRSLAMLALMSTSAEARQEGAQLLRRRDARDFAPFLIGLIRDPIRYEVKPSPGLGKPGEVVIKDGTTNRTRVYTPLPEPNVPMQPGDRIILGPDGLPVISRLVGAGTTGLPFSNQNLANVLGFGYVMNPGSVASLLESGGLSVAQSQRIGQDVAANARSSFQLEKRALMTMSGLPATPERGATITMRYGEFLQIPVGDMELDAQRSAQVARAQMAGDVKAIQDYNAPILDANRRARQVLSEAVGTDKGDDRSAWIKWMVDLFGLAYAPQKSSSEETTVIEQVPLDYQPQAAPPTFQAAMTGISVHHSCFGAGTSVQTIDGPRPIEDLRSGDVVLTQDPRTGELKYQPLINVFHNPPNPTFRVELDGESVVATGIHRLWKAGKGWTMVRELKPGDILRTLGGTATVKSVVEEKVQPVFNLQVADGESYFVGRTGVLAHDNSTINPTPEPFDAVEPVAVSKPTAARSVLGR
ncbi:MAG: polymorphic toxin-type HINT domain-containing protein [Isosphaeraceae bacterium]